jgi:hypothetical protein
MPEERTRTARRFRFVVEVEVETDPPDPALLSVGKPPGAVLAAEIASNLEWLDGVSEVIVEDVTPRPA